MGLSEEIARTDTTDHVDAQQDDDVRTPDEQQHEQELIENIQEKVVDSPVGVFGMMWGFLRSLGYQGPKEQKQQSQADHDKPVDLFKK